jgi:hypothetical protein
VQPVERVPVASQLPAEPAGQPVTDLECPEPEGELGLFKIFSDSANLKAKMSCQIMCSHLLYHDVSN